MGKVRSVTEEEKRERRDKILEAARGRFRRFGYSKTTMEEIAADAGISKAPSIYISRTRRISSSSSSRGKFWKWSG